jgi:HPt (histidine-containing phosphotransfer) domain-containing protein
MDEVGHSIMAFNVMIEKIQESAQLVKQKTADIHAMLHYIPQGILTIEGGNRVHPEYSVHLESILETGDIAGRNLMDLVFSDTRCNADLLSQIETASSACIGEDLMNFEFNAHLLPTEIMKKMPSGETKVLDLNWSPITDENGTTMRLLLCVRDVTELRALAMEANDQKRELAIIGEILAVQQEKFHSFVHGALQFLVENRALIGGVSADIDTTQRTVVVNTLFRNMHTIKGNARTYGLLHLTHVVHEAEQAYDALRQDASSPWDATSLNSQLDAAQHALEEYDRINDIKLGRKGPGRRGSVDRFLMVEKSHVEATKDLLDRVDASSMSALRDALRQARHSLDLIGTEKIPDILAGVLDSLPSLARELGKEPPHSTIHDNGIVVHTQAIDTLKNVFMHLYRNALDHGIETAAQRAAHGKAAVGHIDLAVTMQGEHMVLTLKDDGRGLSVSGIRKKALEKGLIAEGDVLELEEIGQLIFKAGFSTADHVTEVSGRGVGMDAVKGFIAKQGGSIALVFDAAEPNADFSPFETVIHLPAKLAVAPILRLLQQTG